MNNIVYNRNNGLLYKKSDDGDDILLSRTYIQKRSNRRTREYHAINVNGKTLMAHRVIWEMHNGAIPKGLMIDHINGDSTDNRLENLRLVTNQQNMMNRQKSITNTSGYKGVTYSPKQNTWRTQIAIGSTYYTKRGFRTPKEAAKHYNDMALLFHGEYARLNIFCD